LENVLRLLFVIYIFGVCGKWFIGKTHSRNIYGLNEPVNISGIYVRNIIDIFKDLMNP
jgi:hypothetical protein